MKKTNKCLSMDQLSIIILLVIGFIFLRVYFFDSDTYFILATGKYISESGIPYINPFIIHDNFQIIVQQWLFDVLIYYLYLAGEEAALFLFSFCTYALFLLLFWKLLDYWTDNSLKKAVCLLFVGCTTINFECVRPTSITLIVFTLVFLCAEKYKKHGTPQTLLWLLPLGWLEANFHASFFPLLLPILLAYTLPVHTEKRPDWNFLLIISGVFLAGLLNPYGVRGLAYLFLSYNAATSLDIMELEPYDLFSGGGAIIVFSVVVLLFYVYRKKKDVDIIKVVMAAGTIILALPHARDLWFLGFGITPLLAELCPEINGTARYRHSALITIAALLVCVFAYIITPFEETDSEITPVLAAEYLDKTEDGDDIILFTEFDNGAYMEWRGYTVYIDARPELFSTSVNKTKDIVTEYSEVYYGTGDYDMFINTYNFTYLIVSENSGFNVYLKYSEEFSAAIEGNGYILYEAVQ